MGFGLLTVSSTRDLSEDSAGDTAVELITDAHHSVAARDLCKDRRTTIRRTVKRFIADESVDLIVTMGGTGVTPDDVTPEAVRPLFDRELPGFGERFRARSSDDIGERVIASRATAGIGDAVPIFCVPGSEPAVRLALDELILPVGGHLAGLANRDSTDH